jgi:hypothetical protein
VNNDGSETSDSQYSHGSALRMAEASDAEKQSEDSRMALVELVIVNAALTSADEGGVS